MGVHMTNVPNFSDLGEFPWKTVVFLADIYDASASTLPTHLRSDLEQLQPKDIGSVLSGLKAVCSDVRHYTSLDELNKNIHSLDKAVLFSSLGGHPTRNRLMLPPALAEIAHLDFVGLDAMGQAIAHDKVIAKQLAIDCGLSTPRWRVLRNQPDLSLCEEFPIPYVLKPLSEGSSIGISQESLVRRTEDGKKLAASMLGSFDAPILMEEFSPGREVSLVAIQTDHAPYTAVSEVYVPSDPSYFDHNLFDAEEKLKRKLDRTIRLLDEELHSADLKAILDLLHAVGDYGYIRVDGKYKDGRFSFMELTPDAWLPPEGQFAMGFTLSGWTYAQVLEATIRSAALRKMRQCASG